jgi:hypothetical protein
VKLFRQQKKVKIIYDEIALSNIYLVRQVSHYVVDKYKSQHWINMSHEISSNSKNKFMLSKKLVSLVHHKTWSTI